MTSWNPHNPLLRVNGWYWLRTLGSWLTDLRQARRCSRISNRTHYANFNIQAYLAAVSDAYSHQLTLAPSLLKGRIIMAKSECFTNATGAPVADNTNILTAGRRGPALLQDIWLIEKLAQFDREVIPERRMQ